MVYAMPTAARPTAASSTSLNILTRESVSMGTTVYTSCCALKKRNQYSPPKMSTTARPPATHAAPVPTAYIISDESASRVMRRPDTRIIPYAQYGPRRPSR